MSDIVPATGPHPLQELFAAAVRTHDRSPDSFAVKMVDSLLDIARQINATDLHLLPTEHAGELLVHYRIDGVLHPAGTLQQSSTHLIPRLKVLAHLLTYRTDIPQEGRIRTAEAHREMRVSTFPTIHGEKGVIRFLSGSRQYLGLGDLGLPEDVRLSLQQLLRKTTGLLLVCGPAGSGKTTTLYAAMRQLLQESEFPRSLCTLEDPVEALIPGVSQTQIKPDSELTYQRGLASLLRQDPEVILVGEIRDRETAAVVFQASLTGQLVLSTFHAGSAAESLSRLSDMEIEPYLLRSGLRGILAQRLIRRCCGCPPAERETCPNCRGTGYSGRLLLCELLEPELSGLGRAILNRDDADQIQRLAMESGMISLKQRARQALEQGLTTPEEVARVLGSV